ncbi:MAG: hypothetical protein HRT94_03635 [Alphaproteobacteria bacterium]|nr:hypothetical protein [Alphaproteobacteria bacterium]
MDTSGLSRQSLLSTLVTAQQNTSATGFNSGKQKNVYPERKDLVDISRSQNLGSAQPRTRLISETIEQLDNGYRRKQEFERSDGKKFIRIEEFITEDNRSTRTVTQENASGSTTLIEDVYDRQRDGSFRLTQRYTDETGKTSVNITPDALPSNTDFILGRGVDNIPSHDTPPLARGGEFNVVI